MSTIYGNKRTTLFPAFKAPNLMTSFIILFLIVPVLFMIVVSTMSAVANSWTGTGTVIDQGHTPASEGSFLNCAMVGVGLPCFFQDTSSPDSWYVKVRDAGGSEHAFRATKEQFDSAKIGQSFTKQ